MNTDIQQLLNKILEKTYTVNDLARRIRYIKQIAENQVFNSLNNTIESFQNDAEWINSLGGDFFKSFNRENVYELTEALEKSVNSMKKLVLYLPFELPPEQTVEIGQKLRQDFGPNFIFDPKINPNLIAGCALVWNGVYHDYSVHGRIQEKQSDILSVFRTYVK